VSPAAQGVVTVLLVLAALVLGLRVWPAVDARLVRRRVETAQVAAFRRDLERWEASQAAAQAGGRESPL
jgi:hypothetical protein